TQEDANAPDAILVKSDPIVPELAPTSVIEAEADRVSTPQWALAIETVPHAPPVPLHLLNSQFLI
ncbi:MAG: hypothetical protein LC732_06220, partial [Acidobacteria bacterium]|nr:hypothetical protein [Acidobacteriota bacterium]